MTRPMVAAADLDQYRWVGDELADGAVAGYFREFRAANPGELFGGLVRHTKLPPEEMNPALRRFFAEGSAVPDTWRRCRVATPQRRGCRCCA